MATTVKRIISALSQGNDPMNDLLSELLSERDYLLADGATGTNMMEMGLPAGQAPDLWNLDAPEKVTRLHESFLEVGSDIILTNTFSANRFRLRLDNAEERTSAVNEAGARIARAAKEAAGRPVVVAGSMGPSGELMAPHGTLTKESAEEAFTEQATALAQSGVDVLWIESIFAFDELAAAVAAAASAGHIDVKYAMVLGMIPDCEMTQVSSAGNAAGTGAIVALVDGDSRSIIEAQVRRVEKIETAVESKFQEHFVQAMALPHATEPSPNS